MDSLQNSFDSVDWANLIGIALAAIAIIVVTWLLAKVVKAAFEKLTARVAVLQKAGSDGDTIGSSLGTIASLIIWLIGLIALLNLFGLSQALAPINTLLDGFMDIIPNIVGALLVFVVGALLARIVRQLVETALGMLPFDKWLNKAGAEEATGNATISKTLALILYALIMIVVAIAALQVLGISSISDPAQHMLEIIFAAIPNIVAGALLLALGVVIANFASDVLGQILEGFGVDRALHSTEVLPADRSAVPAITRIIQVAIVLFFAVMAAEMLQFPQITDFLSTVLEIGSRVVFGGAIIAAGVLIANQLAKLSSGIGSTLVRAGTIVLFAAIGLRFMGLANSIIELGFGALVIGGAAAAALAFGLGGREAAAQQLSRLQQGATGGAAATPAPDQENR